MKIKKHIPNILSSIRLTSPLVLIPLIVTGNYGLAFISLCGFFLTDAVDGHLARKWHVESDLGAKIDAVADKLILGSLLIPLAITNPIIIINIVLEGFISLVNVARKIKGGSPKTHQLGRIKMIIISLFTSLGYLGKVVTIDANIINVLSIITTVLQTSSLIKYIKDGVKEQKKLKSNKHVNQLNNDDLKEKNLTKDKDLGNEGILINHDYKTEQMKELLEFSNLQLKKVELLKLREEMITLLNKKMDFETSKVKIKK